MFKNISMKDIDTEFINPLKNQNSISKIRVLKMNAQQVCYTVQTAVSSLKGK